jgi:hypothetical protein
MARNFHRFLRIGDIPTKSAAKKRRIKRILYSLAAVIAVAVITVGVAIAAAAPSVEKETPWMAPSREARYLVTFVGWVRWSQKRFAMFRP